MSVSPSPTSSTAPEAASEGTWLEWLTLERLFYLALATVALLLRMQFLDLQPLAPAEAATALRAWWASQGLAAPLDAGTPLLFTLQYLSFFLAGGTVQLARLWPVLVSAAVPLLIYDWRSWVGRRTALVVALLISLSPLFNAFARRGDGIALTLFTVVITLTGWARVRRGDSRGWTILAAGVGLLLISGSAAPAGLIASAVVIFLDARSSDSPRPNPTVTQVIVALAIMVIGGTGFLLHLDGLGLTALAWTQWLGEFNLGLQAWLWGAIRLILDEPLLWTLGVVGILVTLRRNGPARAFGISAIILILLAILQGPNAAATRSVAALMLTVPAVKGLLRFYDRAEFDIDDYEIWLYGGVLLVLLALSVFSLIGYGQSGQMTQIWLLAGALGMAIALTVIFVFFTDRWRVLTMAAMVVTLLIAIFNVATLWRVAFNVTAPRFPAIYAYDTRLGVYDLGTTISELRERGAFDRGEVPIALVTGSPADDVLQWYLKDIPGLQVVGGVSLEGSPLMVIAPAARTTPLSERYSGQDFAILDDWDPVQADRRQQINWALFRIAPWNLPTLKHVLWVDNPLLNP